MLLFANFSYLSHILILITGRNWTHCILNNHSFADNSTFVRLIILSTALPLIYILYMTYVLLMFFIPITGRMGTEGMPDVAIALMALLPMTMVFSFQVCENKLSEKFSFLILLSLSLSDFVVKRRF